MDLPSYTQILIKRGQGTVSRLDGIAFSGSGFWVLSFLTMKHMKLHEKPSF
jgi:hypothetical protein